MATPLSGLRELVAVAPRYDVFLVDLWGVIHDGERPFDGVVDALSQLAAAGRRVIFVTNTSRLGVLVEDTLATMGIGRALYEAVVSSGDVTRAALRARERALFELLPSAPRCFHLGAAPFVPWLFELGLSFVDRIEDADLVVTTGTVHDAAALDLVRAELAPAAARGAPLVCTNPDRIIPSRTNVTLGPGAIAAAYEELGGRVFLYGKPHPPIYAAARAQLADAPAARLVAIGDLLDTDVRGARAAGIAAVLVTGTGGRLSRRSSRAPASCRT